MESAPLTTSEFIGISLVFLAMILGPGIIAIYRNLRRKYLIAIGGLLIGWTGIGTIIMFVYALKGTTFEKTVERVGNKNKKIIMWVVTPLIIILIIWRIADYIRTGY